MIGNQVLRKLIILLLVLETTYSCPNHQHDFREEGFGVATISVHSSVKWITVNKSRLIGITVSSSKDHGAVEISKQLLIKSAVTVCSKCRMATGMVFYDARSTQTSYCTKSCIRTAPYTGHRFSIPTADLSQAERRTVAKYSRPLISSVH